MDPVRIVNTMERQVENFLAGKNRESANDRIVFGVLIAVGIWSWLEKDGLEDGLEDGLKDGFKTG